MTVARLLSLVAKSARARWHNLALTACVLTLATASTSALLGLAVGSPELAGRASLAFGPNLIIEPKAAVGGQAAGGLLEFGGAAVSTLPEASLLRLSAIRHAGRLTAVAPILEGAVASGPAMPGHTMPQVVPVVGVWFTDHGQEVGLPSAATSAEGVFTWWQVEGAWPGSGQGGAQALVGRRAAEALMVSVGSTLSLEAADGRTTMAFVVSGLVSSGDSDEDRVVVELAAAQALLGQAGRMSKVLVAAAVVPDDDLARKDPDTMSDREYERWYCTPYLGAVARQLGEAVSGAEARPVRQVTGLNAQVHGRLSAFSLAMVAVVGAASAAAVGAATAARQLDRARDFALFEALGATRAFASRMTLAENLLAAAGGGAAGAALGVFLGAAVTELAFGVALPPSAPALGAALLLALACAAGGTRVALWLLSRRSLSLVLGGS